ncbi:unnamed protein product [Chrysoparadoxa australica]
MACRDLTLRFTELRTLFGSALSPSDAYRKGGTSGEEKDGLLENAGANEKWGNGAAGTNRTSPPWVERLARVDECIHKIQLRMRDLSSLHTKRLMVVFDGSEDHKEREIEAATRDITNLFRGAEGELQGIMNGEESGLGQGGKAEDKVRENIQRATARKLQGLSLAFRNSQKDYLRSLQSQKQGGVAGGDFDFLADKENARISGIDDMPMGMTPEQHAQITALQDSSAVVAERDSELMSIVQSIEELSTIFKELAVLVIDQGTILDRIDFNMEQVVDHTIDGVQQLHKAEESQKNALPIKCISILVGLIILLLMILVWKHS